jgi:hypothetical protein
MPAEERRLNTLVSGHSTTIFPNVCSEVVRLGFVMLHGSGG